MGYPRRRRGLSEPAGRVPQPAERMPRPVRIEGYGIMTHSEDPARRAANRRTALLLTVVALLFFFAALFKFKGLAP
ncbi:hypothetical protein AZOA_23540 [Azoarcus sp. Aa7]|nr:hypothetical protein [Azoarcus sp. Aa7]